VGYSRAAEMAFTGDPLNAQTALQVGLVSHVVAHVHLSERTRDLAHRIAENPPQAVRWTKRLLRHAMHNRLEDVLDTAAAIRALAHHTEEHDAALAAIHKMRSSRLAEH
jgi:enoyl-CoA hydratase/carnithine racemase